MASPARGMKNSSQGKSPRRAAAFATHQENAAPASPQASPVSPASTSHRSRARTEGSTSRIRFFSLSPM